VGKSGGISPVKKHSDRRSEKVCAVPQPMGLLKNELQTSGLRSDTTPQSKPFKCISIVSPSSKSFGT
jgi:hypothetical protein